MMPLHMNSRSIGSRAVVAMSSLAWIAGLLFLANLTAGCAGLVRASVDEPPGIDTTQRPPITPETEVPSVVAPGGTPESGTTQAAAAAPEPAVPSVDAPSAPPQSTKPQVQSTEVILPAPSATMPNEALPTARVQGVDTAVKPTVAPVTPAVTRSRAPVAVKVDAPPARTPTKVAAAPASPEPAATTEPQKKDIAASRPVQRESSQPLDLKSLETRLKETKAIGVFTKLTLKNQVDELLNQFRAFYQGRLKSTLAELRQAYDRLLLKVLALLQDADPPLAQAIVESREAIWGILADPDKFSTV